MDVLASECSGGGCESGWTLYLEQSLTNKFINAETGSRNRLAAADEEEEEEEDSSMVSDASSGPPLHHFLDDTATSPPFNFSKNNLGLTSHAAASMDSLLHHSQGFSATHFEITSVMLPFYQDRPSSLPTANKQLPVKLFSCKRSKSEEVKKRWRD